jgi:putative transport protein
MLDWILGTLSATNVGALFLILLTGLAFGQIRVAGLNLGSSGVLFTALIAGHFGHLVPSIYGSLGVIFFVYAVGLQAGPRFVHTIRTSGSTLIRLGLLVIGVGAITAIIAGKLLDLSPGMIAGAFAGAMTSTPALAAGLDALRSISPEEAAIITVSYGLAYPLGIIGVVVPIQLLPKLLHRKSAKEQSERNAEDLLANAAFLVENPNIVGCTVDEASVWDFAEVSLSRILHEGDVSVILGSTVLHEGDVVLAVGTADELGKLEMVIGPRTVPHLLLSEGTRNIEYRTVFVGRHSEHEVSTASLSSRYGVGITRLLRLNIALPVGKSMRLEPGDRIRIVGEPEHLDALEDALGHREGSIYETDMLGLISGMLVGVIIGLIPWPISSGMAPVKLGLAGGPLLMSLLAGHFGKIGPISNRIPASARFLLRELGLVLFLAYAGSRAGEHFVSTFAQYGGSVIILAAFTVMMPVIVGFAVGYWVYRYDIGFTLGLLCGGMTSTPALGTLLGSMKSQEPAIAYAAIYPLALIAVTAVTQAMALLL